MKKLTIRDRILASFGIILLLIGAIGGFAFWRLATIERHARAVETDIIPGLYQGSLIKDALAADFQMVVTHVVDSDPIARRQEESLLENQRIQIANLMTDHERTLFTDRGREAFANFKRAYAAYTSSRAGLVSDTVGLNDVAAVKNQIDIVRPRFDTAFNAINDLTRLEQTRGIEAVTEVDEEIYSLQVAITISAMFALIAGLTSGYALFRAITRPLGRLSVLMDTMRQGDFTQRMEIERHDEFGDLADGFNRMAEEVMGLVGQVQKSGIRVSTSMTEIAATSKQQQATAGEVAATTTEIGATSKEIAATSKELVRTMNEVTTVAEHTAGLAAGGQTGLTHMEETMSQVMEAAGSINAKLAVLNEKAGNINQVVTTITKVADQTNLLSLNAAIEAEKAGEYGRGFAVVSSEIRRLADQTAVATYDIEQMVEEIQAAVSAGVMGMDKFSEEVRRGMNEVNDIGAKLSEIITQVQALVPRFETVSEGMQGQATGAEQISDALLQLTEATHQTVESLRQSTSAIEELNQVSGSLHGSISHLKLAAA